MTAADDLALIEELEALAEHATPGPWLRHGSHAIKAEDHGGMRVGMFPSIGQAYRSGDADLMVAAINALPRLLALAREAIAGREVSDHEWPATYSAGGHGPYCWCGKPERSHRAARNAKGESDGSGGRGTPQSLTEDSPRSAQHAALRRQRRGGRSEAWQEIAKLLAIEIGEMTEPEVAVRNALATQPTPSEDVRALIAEIREVHVPSPTFCSFCSWEASEVEWPCDAIRLADHISPKEKP